MLSNRVRSCRCRNDHVGLYIGNGQMVHAPKPGENIRIDPFTYMPIYAASGRPDSRLPYGRTPPTALRQRPRQPRSLLEPPAGSRPAGDSARHGRRSGSDESCSASPSLRAGEDTRATKEDACPKRLVICCDGTWNDADQAQPNNVVKVRKAVAPTGGDGREQRVHYNPGVGTRRFEMLRGGAFGFGLSEDVRSVYRFLVESFDPGDELFFFGFSRGAYTARSTVGMVRNCGILRREHAGRVDDGYALYHGGIPAARGDGPPLRRAEPCPGDSRLVSLPPGTSGDGIAPPCGSC